MIVLRLLYPAREHLISIAFDDGARLVEVGDLTSIVRSMPEIPIKTVAPLRWINRRTFVEVSVARQWAVALDKAQHSQQAKELSALLDWVNTKTPEGDHHREERSS